MNKAITKPRLIWALVLNALVLPGSGHVMLGHRVLGTSISIIVVALLFVCLASYISSYVHAMSNLSLNADSISSTLAALSGAYRENLALIKGSVIVIALAWLFGIVDILVRIHRYGRNTEMEQK